MRKKSAEKEKKQAKDAKNAEDLPIAEKSSAANAEKQDKAGQDKAVQNKTGQDRALSESALALSYADKNDVPDDDFNLKKPQKQSLFKTLSGAMDTARNVGNLASEVYNDWIKPVRENWSQIKRRMSFITTLISIVFFVLYVPFLLIGKIGKDLALGYDVALYVCIGIYILTLVALLIVTLASDKTNTVAMEKRRRKISKIILMVVRFASLAIGITALIISAVEGSAEGGSAVVDTVAIIFAVMSIVFSGLPLLFGGFGGFIKWLISPAKIKFRFSFVVLEWYQSFTAEQQIDKNVKKLSKRYGERVGACIDAYFIPMLGKKYIKSVDANAIIRMLESVPSDDLNMCEWIVKRVFEYAEDCKYVETNPCDKLELSGDINRENKVKKSGGGEQKPSAMKRFFSLFSRKDTAAADGDIDDDDSGSEL